VYHKSYEHESCVEINVRPDGIEILSFPGPLPPIDKKRLRGKRIVARDYRNRRIFERHVLPLVEAGYIDLTFPNIPRTPKQKYITSSKGIKKL